MQFVARSKGNCPGTPPEIAQKVNEYVEWKDRFDANPAAVLNSAKVQRGGVAENPVMEMPSKPGDFGLFRPASRHGGIFEFLAMSSRQATTQVLSSMPVQSGNTA